MDIRLLGSVEICDGGQPVPLPRAGERCVLASLALDPGRRIHVDTLVDRLWGSDPPANAAGTVASYLRTVRRAIEHAGGRRDWLVSHRPAAYQLDIDPGLVDYHRFNALVAQAGRERRDGRPAESVARYREAVGLRSAEALGNLTGQWAANRRYTIEQEYLDAVCAMYEGQLALGEYAAVAGHATRLVLDVIPTDRMIALAVHGLARSGRHTTIPGFLARATQRMWETAQVRPSPQVIALGRRLVENPGARLPPPRLQPDQLDEAGDGDASPASGRVTMIAQGSQQVVQAGRDQYITNG
jgi:DNA-binding SARP family transcriptional activator